MRELSDSSKLAIALALTAVGGYVDAVGYIALFQIFTANMSGNSIHVGMGAGILNVGDMMRPLCAIGGYLGGLIAARVALDVAARSNFQRVASLNLAVEALLLVVFSQSQPAMHAGQVVDMHSSLYFSLVGLLAFSMGIQAATLTHIGPLTIYTTFVTGTLTKFSESLTRALFWFFDQRRNKAALSHIRNAAVSQQDVRDSTSLAGVWISYVVGAALGTVAKQRWEFRCFYYPVLVLAVVILIDQLRPIAVQEEKHQKG